MAVAEKQLLSDIFSEINNHIPPLDAEFLFFDSLLFVFDFWPLTDPEKVLWCQVSRGLTSCSLLPSDVSCLTFWAEFRAVGLKGWCLSDCFSLSTFISGKEFFFLDNETRLCKIAPEGWSEQPQKKTSLNTFTLFLRIKFFISCCAQLQ